MTTTKNEGGSAVQQLFPVPVPPSNKTLVSALTALVGEDRAEAIAKVPAYTSSVGGADGMRGTFEKIVTDGVWRCPNRAAARSWAKAGGKVWVAEWLAGSTYPTNIGSYCQGADRVCHEVRRVCFDPMGASAEGRMIYTRLSGPLLSPSPRVW
jgi:hypothetical protein